MTWKWQSSLRAVSDVLGSHVTHRWGFYHLTQSTWRKVHNAWFNVIIICYICVHFCIKNNLTVSLFIPVAPLSYFRFIGRYIGIIVFINFYNNKFHFNSFLIFKKIRYSHSDRLVISVYMSNDECRHLCGMLDGLAFLPVSDAAAGMQYLRTNIPNINDLDDLVTYFDSTSVSGCLRSTARSVCNQINLVLRITRSAAQFP